MVTIGSITNPKVEAHGLFDVVGMAISKTITERLMAPYIGNATIKSSLIKGILGGILYGKAGKYGNMVASGMVIDAAEDAAVVITNMVMPQDNSSSGPSF